MKKFYILPQKTKALRLLSLKFLGSFIFFPILSPFVLGLCTIAVVSGSVPIDGKPLLWKNRDITDQDNVVQYFYGEKYSFISITQASDRERVYGGINTEGFALLNSVSYDLEGDEGTTKTRFLR